MSSRPPRERLQRARVDLLLGHPFFGSLAMYLDLKEVKGSWCPSFASDGRRFYFDPDFIGGLSDGEVMYCVGHAVLHLALAHALRKGGREQKLWDLATDFAVDAILLAPKAAGGEGMHGPKGSSFRPEFRDMSAEEIYRKLLESKRRKPGLDTHLEVGSNDGSADTTPEPKSAGNGASEGSEDQRGGATHEQGEGARGGARGASEQEPEHQGVGDQQSDAGEDGAEDAPTIDPQLEETWTRRTIEAATTAKLRGTLPSTLERAVKKLLEARVPWQQVLAEFIHAFFKNDYRWMPPNRRFVSSGILLPSPRGEQLRMVVAIDTSGSIDEDLLTRFASELQGILIAVPEFWIEVFGCDADLGYRKTFETGELLELPKVAGGGGTDFRPVFRAVEAESLAPDVLLYMTDGFGTFPSEPPEYAVLWLMPEGSRVTPPFGRALLMEPSSPD